MAQRLVGDLVHRDERHATAQHDLHAPARAAHHGAGPAGSRAAGAGSSEVHSHSVTITVSPGEEVRPPQGPLAAQDLRRALDQVRSTQSCGELGSAIEADRDLVRQAAGSGGGQLGPERSVGVDRRDMAPAIPVRNRGRRPRATAKSRSGAASAAARADSAVSHRGVPPGACRGNPSRRRPGGTLRSPEQRALPRPVPPPPVTRESTAPTSQRRRRSGVDRPSPSLPGSTASPAAGPPSASR